MSLNPQEKQNILQYIKSQQLNITSHQGFRNFSKNLIAPGALVLDIKDIKSLQQLIKNIYILNELKPSRDRIIVRVAAGGGKNKESESYSFTQGITGDIIIRLTGDPFQTITKTGEAQVMRVGASVQIGELNQTLYDEHNLVLPTASLIPYVTVAGLAANAGHGTGKDQPSFSGLIRAMTFCLPNGELKRIDATHKDFAIIRAAHLGLFGVLVDVELECMPAKKLQCVLEARSVPELIAEIKNGLFVNDDYVSVMYIPTYQANELTNKHLKNILIYRFRPVDKAVNDVNYHEARTHYGQKLQIKLHKNLHINHFLRRFPKLTPQFLKHIVTPNSIGKSDTLMIGPWTSYHYQTVFPKDLTDMGVLFPSSADGHEIIQAFEKLVATLQKYGNDNQFPVNYAAYLRVLSGTNGGLSTSNHPDNTGICGFDIVTSQGIKSWEAFQAEMSDYLINELHGKPHWGKYIREDLDYAKIYGQDFQVFLRALEDWYQVNHLKLENSMFLNTFFCKILNLPFAPREIAKRAANQFFDAPLSQEKQAITLAPGLKGRLST